MSTNRTGVIGLALLIMALPQVAAAYVDPGSGALIWQIAAAAVFGSLFRLRNIATWFRNRMSRSGSATSKSPSSPSLTKQGSSRA